MSMTIDDVGDVFIDFFGEERVDVQDDNGILVHFPKVTVTNEMNQSTEITHLYAKIEVEENGSYGGTFSMIRSELTEDEIAVGYVHSHLPHLSENRPSWEPPCLGRGPLRNTLSTLSTDPNEDLWKLFCLELDKFVATESLAGGPYVRLNNISRKKKIPYIISYGNYREEPNMIDEFVDYIIDKKPFSFSFSDGVYEVALSSSELVIVISNLFFEWCNKLPKDKWDAISSDVNAFYLVKASYDGAILKKLSSSSGENYRNAGMYLFSFKDKDVNYEIVKSKGEDSEFTVISPELLGFILRKLLLEVNFKYGSSKYKASLTTVFL